MVLTVALSIATWSVIVVLDWLLHDQHRVVAFGSFTDLLGATGAAVAIIVGVLGVVVFLLGDGRDTLWTSWGVLLLGALTLGVARTSPLAAGGARSSVLSFVGPATVPVALWMMARPLWRAPLPAAAGRARSALRAGAAIGALTAALQLSPHAARVLGGTTGASPHLGEMLGQGAMVAVWLALTAAYHMAGPARRARLPYAGFAALGLGMAQSRVALILSHSQQDIWLTCGEMVRLVGLFVALMVMAGQLQRRLSEDRSALFDSLIGIGVAERQRRARGIMQEVLTHDVRSGLFAIDGAAHTLANHYEQLSPGDRDELTRILSTAVDHLREMVDRQLEGVQVFDLADVIGPVLREERKGDRPVQCEVGRGITVAGRPADTLAVLQTVMSIARRGGAESATLRVAATRYGSSVLVSVAPEDDIPPGCDVIGLHFRPVPRAAPSGETVEMYVCARLMFEQGGELLHAVASGHDAFALRLPVEVPSDAR